MTSSCHTSIFREKHCVRAQSMYSIKQPVQSARAILVRCQLLTVLHHSEPPPLQMAGVFSNNCQTTAPRPDSSRIESFLPTVSLGYRHPSMAPQKHDIPGYARLLCQRQTTTY